MSDPDLRTCVVLQPGYLPWPGFFEQMWRADVFVYLDDVQFDKHGWRNRNRIKGPAGPQWLTVPVRVSGMDKPRINEVLIDSTRPNWETKHLKTLRMNYGRCPFFDWLYPQLEQVLTGGWTYIADLNVALVELLAHKMSLKREIRRSSAMEVSMGRCERLIEICHRLECDHYYAGAASRDYMDIPAFKRAGIQVAFQNYVHPIYPQSYGAFVSHLSVVDLLFNCGPQSLDILTTGQPVEGGVGAGG